MTTIFSSRRGYAVESLRNHDQNKWLRKMVNAVENTKVLRVNLRADGMDPAAFAHAMKCHGLYAQVKGQVVFVSKEQKGLDD